ncbi:MAG: agmatinase [Proteobacteria bacterium]|nr:agmatinase [Pseudomonadota bacterium]MBU1714958.1 agmatinase [Pseudomonadota bacterium]
MINRGRLTVNNQSSPSPETVYHLAKETNSPQADHLNIIGVSFDGTACFRKGTSAGPTAIRQVSVDLETYSPYLKMDLSEIDQFYDLGDLAPNANEDVDKQWQAIRDNFSSLIASNNETIRFLALGGEHSISYIFIKRCLEIHPDMVLLHLDAHADLRDGYQGYHYSHAAVIRRCLDHFGTNHHLAQFGIRSGTKEEYNWMTANKTLYSDLPKFLGFLEKIPRDRPIYLTLDLDYFDPAFLPGTGTPEAGGEDFRSFIEIVEILKNKKLVGADVVELAPNIDPTGNSEVFAAKVVRELILAFHGEDGHVR